MQRQTQTTAINIGEFLKNNLAEEISKFSCKGKITSGFSNLDEVTDLYPGMYVLGGTSSLGKTTYLHQMSDQIAKTGRKVIYFSLEQTALELVSKSLSRTMGLMNASEALTSLKIREGIRNSLLMDAINEYSSYASNVTVVEGGFSTNVNDIVNYVCTYIKENECNPVVVVDYLQILAPIDHRMSPKDAVDYNVRILKMLQLKYKLVILIISSFNRSNYTAQIDFESFKESGGIEYTADVVWGLQLKIVDSEGFEKRGIDDKRKAIRDAKAEIPRKIELVCLKNRFGQSSYQCSYDFYPQVDLFKPRFD